MSNPSYGRSSAQKNYNSQNVISLDDHAHRNGKPDPNDLSNPVSQLKVYRRLSREWRAHLSHAELSLLLFMVDRSVGWSHGHVRITKNQILNGDTKHGAGFGGKPTQLKALLGRLCSLHVLNRIPAAGEDLRQNKGDTYEINYRMTADEMLSITKKREEELEKGGDPRSENRPTPGQNFDHPPVGKSTPINRTNTRTSDRTTSPGSADASPAVGSGLGEGDYSSPEENLDSVPAEKSENVNPGSPKLPLPVRRRQRPTAKPAQSKTAPSAPVLPVAKKVNPGSTSKTAADVLAEAKARPARNTQRGAKPTDLEKTFVSACTDSFAEIGGYNHVKWTRKDLGKVRTVFINRWGKDVEDLHQFFEFVGSKWSQLRKEYFKWASRPAMPVAPDIGFLILRNKEFVAAWRDKATFDGLKKLKSWEQKQYHYLTKDEGKSHEEALRIIGEEAAQRKMRAENEQTEKNVRTLRRLAERDRKEAERARNQKIFSAGKPRDEFLKDLAIKAEESRRQVQEARNARVRPRSGETDLIDDILENGLPEFPEWDENK